MSFRTKLLLTVLLIIFASVSIVAYGVTHYTRAAFEEMDAQRTEALVAQFNKEFAQRGEEIAQQVKNITNSEITLHMAMDLARPNADQSLYVSDANGAAQDHNLVVQLPQAITLNQNQLLVAIVAHAASIALRPKLASNEFGVIDLTFPHWRHTISDREPRCNRSAN